MISKQNLFLFLLILLGGFLHFFNLLWGAPYFFHPDERNIAYAINQLSFPTQLNPHFFAYGALPIYVVFFTMHVAALFVRPTNDFATVIFLLRFFSASLSTLTILSVYIIGLKIWNGKVGILAAVFATLSVGLIQFAHFGTFEIWTTFFSVWLFYVSLLFLKEVSKKRVILSGLLMGMLLAIKVSNVVLVVFPLLCGAFFYFKESSFPFKRILQQLFFYGILIVGVYFLTNPYVLLDTKDFFGSMHYESSVAFGTLPVFYTGSFFNTAPIIFQVLMVFPFLMNPLLLVLSIISIIWLFVKTYQKQDLPSVLLLVYIFILFFSEAFFFVKWTRYMLPTLPFLYLLVAIWINRTVQVWQKLLIGISVSISVIFVFAFMKTVYFSEPTQTAAATWAALHIPNAKSVIAEPYDLGVLPFNEIFPNIVQLPLYDIDQNVQDVITAKQEFSTAQVFILPSQRLIHSRLINQKVFPQGSIFYKNLLTEKTSYKKVYQTPCDIFCKIIYMGDPLFHVEETANVFDRPTVMIFEKNK